jgi:hypothetical protein
MRVLTKEQFRKGLIPSREDFEVALTDFVNGVVIPGVASGQVAGGLAYGSVPRGDANLGSDLDYLLVLNDRKYIEEVTEVIGSIWRKYNVPINIIPPCIRTLDKIELLDRAFRVHLEESINEANVVGQNPLGLFPEDPMGLRESAEKRLNISLTELQTRHYQATFSDEKYCRLLKSILEKPNHTMREVARILSKGEIKDSKQGVETDYYSLVSDTGLIESIELINSVGGKYLNLLKRRKASDFEGAEEFHRHMRVEIRELYDLAYEFIEGNLPLIKQS